MTRKKTAAKKAAKTTEKVEGLPAQTSVDTKALEPINTELDKGAPVYRVTVKTKGFRRLGRAWHDPEEVELSDDDLKVLQADPEFDVTAL